MRIIPPEKVAAIVEFYPHASTKELAEKLGLRVSTVYQKANKLGLKKSKEYQDKLNEINAAQLAQRGDKHRFKLGSLPFNKGQKMSESTREKCSPTMFKKGQMPKNTKPLGYERINKEGYIEIKTETGFKTKQRIIWEERFGAVPAGHIVTFADGDNRNFAPENIIVMSRADNALRNSRYSPEYKEALALIKQIDSIVKQSKNAKKHT